MQTDNINKEKAERDEERGREREREKKDPNKRQNKQDMINTDRHTERNIYKGLSLNAHKTRNQEKDRETRGNKTRYNTLYDQPPTPPFSVYKLHYMRIRGKSVLFFGVNEVEIPFTRPGRGRKVER